MMPRAAAGRFRPEALLHPTSVAVIGADTQEGAQITANLLLGGFRGTLETVSGVEALAATPDLAIVCAPADQLEPIFTALGRRGTHAAVVPGPGTGLRDLAERTGVRSLGPGSFGIAIPGIGLNATAAHLPPPAGRIALVSQSAALCRAVIDWAAPNGVGFSHIVGIGGNGDIGFGLVLDWMSRDSATGAILLDIRRIKDPRIFLSAARAAARLRPVVAIRAGSRMADPSGDADATFEAALRRCGVLCVSSLADLLAAAETLTRARPVRAEALAIVTNATGPARLAADAALRDGIPLAGDVAHADPRDPARLAALAIERAAVPGVGGVLAVHAPTGAGDDIALQAIIDAAKGIKLPLLVCAMGETTGAEHRRRLAAAGLPAFAEPEQAVRGFFHLVQDRRNRAAARELPPSAVLSVTPDRALVRRRFARARAAGQALLLQD
jgi:acetyltransferase